MSFLQGVQQFNQGQFYECHDTLEAVWIEASEMDKRFYQGILQIAVACHHLSNHNLRGAMILLGEGIKRLSDYEPDYQRVDVSQLIEESASLLETLQQLAPEQLNSFVQQVFSSEEATNQIEKTGQLPKLVIL
jgi:uncharacterized protein